METLGGAEVAVPLTLDGTVPGGALDEPAKAAADGGDCLGVVVVAVDLEGDEAALFPDLGAAAIPVPEDGADATRGLALDAAAVGDVDLLGGMPKRAKAESAVSFGGADLALAAPEGKLLALEGEVDALPPLRGDGAAAAAVGVVGLDDVDASGCPSAFMGCRPANGSAGSYRGAPCVG